VILTQDFEILLNALQFLASVDEMEFNTGEVHSSLGLTGLNTMFITYQEPRSLMVCVPVRQE